MTVDCGEGKHDLCIGWGDYSYLFPQLAGERFECRCSCHKQQSTPNQEEIQQ